MNIHEFVQQTATVSQCKKCGILVEPGSLSYCSMTCPVEDAETRYSKDLFEINRKLDAIMTYWNINL